MAHRIGDRPSRRWLRRLEPWAAGAVLLGIVLLLFYLIWTPPR